jgi:hypothetical protein
MDNFLCCLWAVHHNFKNHWSAGLGVVYVLHDVSLLLFMKLGVLKHWDDISDSS